MHQHLTQLMPLRARLCLSLEALKGQARALSPGTLALEVERIRALAGANGLAAAERVAAAFSAAIAAEGRGALYGCWFSALADAIGCEAADPDPAAEACVAAVMVRYH